MELQDGGQEMVASPSTPATGKSKLDTLPKEELIKFAKKQMMLLQKVKSRCAELEKEIEELKTKPVVGGTDDIIQALTERLDAVLLEKAEIQQQCQALRKENVKTQQEAEAALAKEEELQKKIAQISADRLKEIGSLKNEIATAQSKHEEVVAELQKELQAELKKQERLTEQLECHSGLNEEIKRLQEEVHQTKAVYEEQTLNLKKQLEASVVGREEEIAKLQDVIENNSKAHQKEISTLGEEMSRLKAAHQEEMSKLIRQLEASAKVCEEEQNKIDQLKQDLAAQYREKENSMRDELHACKEKYECELEHVRQTLRSNEEDQIESRNVQLEPEVAERTRHLENALRELESQHSILRDELTYMSNVKTKLELEIQHVRDEYFHEREDLEFKIDELQLAKEEHCCVIEKLKLELQAARDQYENATKESSLGIQDLIEKHRREICEVQQTASSSLDRENQSLALEIQALKEQCERHIEEKEEAIASYESLRETMEVLQTELGESAGKIKQEFESMRQQQASDVDELQKKLRTAFSEKDVLLETVNRLREEAEQFSSQREEMEELKRQVGSLQEEKEKLVTSLRQKEAAIKELEMREQELSLENTSILDQMKSSAERVEDLEGKCHMEEATARELREQMEALGLCKGELERQVGELTEKLKCTSGEKEKAQQKLGDLEQQMETLRKDHAHLLSEVENLHGENNKIKEERDQAAKELENVEPVKGDWLVSKEKTGRLETELQAVCNEKEHLTQLLAQEKGFRSLVLSQLHSFCEKMGSPCPDKSEGNGIIGVLQAANEFLAKMKEEERNLASQKDENVLLRQEMQRLREESTADSAELRSRLNDYEREKCLLREELEGTFSEKEALQLDIQELKQSSEKVRNENQELLVRIQDLSEQLALQEGKIKEQEEKWEEERKNLNLVLEQKETERRSVEAELSLLKTTVQGSAEASSVNADQQSLEREKIEKTLKEKEEKLNKIKAVAVKLRKELDSSRKEMQTLKEELSLSQREREQLSSSMGDLIQAAESYKNLLLEFDKQAEQLDFEKERARNFEHQIDDVTRQLESSAQQVDQLRSSNEDLLTRIETLQTNAKLLENQLLETQKAKAKIEKELEAEKLLKEQKIKDHSNAVKEVEELQTQLQKEKKCLQKVLEELELAKKDAQKSTLMDMEIADYERFVKELNQKITDKSSRIEDLEQEIKIQKQKHEMLHDELKSFQNSVQQYEEKNAKIKQLLVKTKKELSDSKQAENELLRLQASLKGELEASQQQVEVFKIQLAEITSEKHKIQEHLRTSLEQHQRVQSTYQQKLATLQEACAAAKAEHAAVTAEFESYKVRVHNVLKQKIKNSQSETDVTKQEREHMEKIIDQLRIKLQDTQHNLQMNVTELQALQSEHDTLLERHNKILQETVAKEAELREKLCTLQSENMVMKTEHAQAVSQLTAQNEALRSSFRDQVRHLQEEHRKTVETLQQQLSKVEAQLFQLKSEPSAKSPAASSLPTKTLRERKGAELPPLDVHTVAREEGEGMETTDTESISSSSTPVPSLEQLLNTPETKFEPPQWEVELTKEQLIQKLNSTSKSAEHLNGLLRESEATNVILMEQIKLLKSEIRRLERNQEREKSVANLEYLKNVLLQFIFLKSGSERERLLPVIDTMLQLSPEEKGKLIAIAQGEEESTSQPSGWASYLHSWSGLR